MGKHTLEFQHKALKESGFKLRESPIIVQALKSLGEENITENTIAEIRKWLNPDLRARVLKDTKTVTGWTYKIIGKICEVEEHG
jgi:hypothetical protein